MDKSEITKYCLKCREDELQILNESLCFFISEVKRVNRILNRDKINLELLYSLQGKIERLRNES